uniref:Poly(A) RNA polymerase mitochondrial-like central palm domain-containing protein n=1 Tax=Euplotes harpa TaxID=151035 RepID=A0A7S3J5U9_9SPIT|mmetsp:Transcript_19069/g.21957  ORF Transcript_19069/g.21957 Transcript_19069/m.21957 type:complete len:429 (+) Transcript_19069:385-1671(+)
MSEESKYVNPPDHTELLGKFETMFAQLPTKKTKEDKAEDNLGFEYNAENIKELNEKLDKLLQSEENLSLLEYHISEVYNASQVSEEDYGTLAFIMNKIESLLASDEYIRETYGIPKVENFGSSANTLWNMDSDVDIVIEFTKPGHHEKGEANKYQKGNRNKDKKEDKKQSKYDQLKYFDTKKALIDIRNVLRVMAKNKDIESIFNSRVPLLKFKHAKTMIDIDICLNNSIGIPNSRMTRLFSEFDQRAHIMIKYLRTLLKQSGLLNGEQGCLSSYCIILMVIAFLQQQEEPVLPNLHQGAMADTDKTFYAVSSNKFGRMDCKEIKFALNEDLKQVGESFASKNTKTVAQLVIEFLRFYFLNSEGVMPIIDVSRGGFVFKDTDKLALFDIVEPLDPSSKVGLGCRKDEHHAASYVKFAFDFCKNIVDHQ